MAEKKTATKRVHHYPAKLSRDHARPLNAPAPSADAVEARLGELVRPATWGLAEEYRRLGCRWRALTLPVMVALVVALVWRRVPSVSELVRTFGREGALWEAPRRVTQQALSERRRTLPAELFAGVFRGALPALRERAAARSRPLPPDVASALGAFGRVWALDATTLEALFRKVGLLRGAEGAVLGGKLCALLDVATKLPVHLWHGEDADANEKTFLARVEAALPPGTLLLLDRGFTAFDLFDRLTEAAVAFVTRARDNLAVASVERVLLDTPALRDRLVRVGSRRRPCASPLRLVEARDPAGGWHGYLTNEPDPDRLPAASVVALYGRRWRVEEAFLVVKRLLGLSYLPAGAANAVELQVWATWLLYAALVDLADDVAAALDVPLDRLSLEMVFRGLYHYAVARSRGQAGDDPAAYLAAQTDLGILKARRKHRERADAERRAPLDPLDKGPTDLNL